MPTELEELVGFIVNPNPQIRLLATENLVPYSRTQPAIFKTEQLLPVRNLKALVRDEPKIAEHVITMLVNLSGDQQILENLATDDKFIDVIFSHLINPLEPNANLLSMLLANMAKWDGFKRIIDRKQASPEDLRSNDLIINQLVDLFVKGADGSFNKHADFDYLAYVFADLARHAEVRQYFVKKQDYDGIVPLTKLTVFTEHKSDVRRKGVASTIKNVAFDIPSHPAFLAEDEVNIMPYILLPIMGSEGYDDEEMLEMLPDLQLLPPDKQRDPDKNIILTHLETLTLLTTTRQGRDLMREIKIYPIIRETHARVNDEEVCDACDRLVQVLMRDEDDSGDAARVVEVDEEEEMVEV